MRRPIPTDPIYAIRRAKNNLISYPIVIVRLLEEDLPREKKKNTLASHPLAQKNMGGFECKKRKRALSVEVVCIRSMRIFPVATYLP